MIKCPNCSAELNFSPKDQLVVCEYCRSKFTPSELKEKVSVAEESNNTFEGKEYLCSQCGAKLLTFDETAITFCSYCGSQAMIESKMMRVNSPEYIIPFKKTKEDCINSYKKLVSRSIFAPSYMKSDLVVNKFRGIYMPYCIYKVSYHGRANSMGSKYSYRSGDYKIYDDYMVKYDVDSEYDGISYDLTSNYYDKFSHSIPYNFKEAENFNPNYLSGFYADAADIDESNYYHLAEMLASADSTNRLLKHKDFYRYGCYPRVNMRVSDSKKAMFPVYFLAIRDKKNTYVNYAIVNGQTGKAAVDLPIDFKKYILISIMLTIPIFLLINNFLVVTPNRICFFSLILSIVSLIISNYQMKKIYERENHLDDIGYSAKNKESLTIVNETRTKVRSSKYFYFTLLFFLLIPIFSILSSQLVKISAKFYISPIIIGVILLFILIIVASGWSHKDTPNVKVVSKTNYSNKKIKISAKDKFKYRYKQIISIIIGAICLIFDFVYDYFYYGAAIIIFTLTILSFYDLIKQHNLVVSTKLPQLEKRGGDEHE